MVTSTGAQTTRATASTPSSAGSVLPHARAYFASDISRSLQTALAVLWLLDGGLQFQSFMYSKGFINMLTAMAAGQPAWLSSSLTWAAHTAGRDLTVFNTAFALVQVAIGLGLLYRPTARFALALSVVWAVIVWWSGEAFGMLFMSMASPLTGAPGAVSLYGLLALVAWPNGRPGGLLGIRGTRFAWATVWVLMAWLWLEAPSSNPDAISNAVNAAPSGMSWLSTVQNWAANGSAGIGLPIALFAAGLSLVIGLGVVLDWHARPLLKTAIALNLAYWVFGQGFGGIFQGGATDPNSGPLFVLFACVLLALLPYRADADRFVGSSPGPDLVARPIEVSQ
jgi:hypothetical protein